MWAMLQSLHTVSERNSCTCVSIIWVSWQRRVCMSMMVWWWRYKRWRVEICMHMKRSFTQTRPSHLGFTLICATCRWVWSQCVYDDWNRVFVGPCVVGLSPEKKTWEVLLGHMTIVDLLRWGVRSVPFTLNKIIRTNYNDSTRLWSSARAEVQAFVGLLPAIVSSWARDWCSSIVATDASEFGFGVGLKECEKRCLRE